MGMNVCLRVCGYGILIVNIAQLWIITSTREDIMDYSALMAFGGAEVGWGGGFYELPLSNSHLRNLEGKS